MKYTATTCLLMLLLLQVRAQNLSWVNGVGGVGADEIRSSHVDAAGNVYIAGIFSSTVDFDPGSGIANLTAVGDGDIYVAKYDAGGNYMWAKGFGGSVLDYPNDVEVDASGNVYVTGTFQNTVDFNPAAPSTAVVTAVGLADIFFMKYDAAGNFLWKKTIGAANNDVGYGLGLDNAGNIYLSGTFYNSPDFNPGSATTILTSAGGYDMFVGKYDNNGNYLWARGFGGTATDNFWNLDVDNAGNVYVIGYFQNTVNFNAGATPAASLVTTGGLDIVIAKYTTTGTYAWAKKLGGTGNDYGRSIRIDAAGYLYFTGYFSNTANFNPGGTPVVNLVSAGGTDIFLSKYNANGTYVWAKKMGGTGNDNGWDLSVLEGNIFATGYFASATANFNPAATANLTNPGGSATADGYVAKYDTSGAYQWANRIGGTTSLNDFGYSVANHANGSIYVGGSFSGTTDFDFNTTVVNNRTSNGVNDIFLAKYAECPLPVITALAATNTTICLGDSTTISIAQGSLNGATHWQWYSGSCGGTPVGTGISITVAPTAAATTYYVRGEGGCAGAVGCSNISIQVLSPVIFSQNMMICQGDSAFLENAWRKVNGTYYDTLVAASGCDSVRITSLSVVSAVTAAINASICQGDSIVLGGAWRKLAGTYYDTLTSTFGCDSIVITTLTVHPVYTVPLATSICMGDSLYLGSAWRKIAGTYNDTLQTIYGCDSVLITTLTIKPVYSISQNAAICQGDSLYLGGAWRKIPGIYTNHYQSSLGCDSNIHTTLTVHPIYLVPVTVNICQGDSVLLGGAWRKTQGVFYDTLQTVQGCDSVIQSTLFIRSKYIFYNSQAICEGDSVFLANDWQKTPGVYRDTLHTAFGCDSIFVITLAVDFINPSVSLNGFTLTSNTNAGIYQWLRCGNGFTTIPGATDQSYTASGPGNFAVIITKGACYDTSYCYQLVSSGVMSVFTSGQEINVYPNPAIDELHVNAAKTCRRMQVVVMDNTGKTVGQHMFSNTAHGILPMHALPAGLYIIHIVADDYQSYMKIIKQ